MSRLSAAIIAVVLASASSSGAWLEAAGQTPAAPAIPSDPARLAEMRFHFNQITVVQEAVIRGDLEAVRAPARELTALPIPWRVPAAGSPYVNLIRDAARRLVTVSTRAEAADNAAFMLGICGDCHQAVGVNPAPSPVARPDVGGTVGHMLEHQRAMDELLQGLVIPSLARWNAGAKRLQTAPLQRGQFLPDRRLTSGIREAEAQVHKLAQQASAAATLATSARRAGVYAQLLATCAQCHEQHAQVWGPRQDQR